MNTKAIRYLTYLALIQIRSRSCQDEELSTPIKEFNETPSGLSEKPEVEGLSAGYYERKTAIRLKMS